VDELETEIQSLKSAFHKLHQRIGGGDGAQAASAASESRWDQYDKQVLSRLSAGQTVTLSRLVVMYEDAGLRQQSTIKSRVKALTRNGPFEQAGQSKWSFVGAE
jgi:hypothetical protein